MTTIIPTTTKKPRRPWPWVLAAALLLGGVGGSLYIVRQREAQAQAVPLTTSTATAEQGTLRVSVSGPGTLTAPHSMTVSTTQGGTVGTLPNVGDHLTKGQLITTLSNDTLLNNLQTAELNLQKAQAALAVTTTGNASSAINRQSSVNQAQTTLTQAQQGFDDAQRALTAQQKLLSIGATSQSDVQAAQSSFIKAQSTLQSAQANLQAARTQVQTGADNDQQNVHNQQLAVQQAQLALNTAQQAVAQLKVYAPISGVVSSVSVTSGTNLNLNASGAALLTILDDHTLYLPAQIDETEISGVKVGQDAQVTLDAIENRTFPGKVITVSPSGTQSNGISVFTATVQIANPDGLLKSGMTAEAEIIQSEATGLLVPSKAIESLRTRSYVEVVKTDASGKVVGEPTRTRVRTGATDGTNTVIVSGLEAGQQVLVAGSGSSRSTSGTSRTSGSNRTQVGPPGGFGGQP